MGQALVTVTDERADERVVEGGAGDVRGGAGAGDVRGWAGAGDLIEKQADGRIW